jgi:peptidyl-prolyl cis-trans isomerase A (cyclophilin A)
MMILKELPAMTRWILSSIFAAALASAPLAAQDPGPRPTVKPPAPQVPTAKPAAPATAAVASAKQFGPGVYAHFATSQGNITVRLFDKETPKTVENFVGLAEGKKQWTDPRTKALVRRPYFNNLTFHRVLANFMIQGGDPLGSGTGGPGYTFADEFVPTLRHSKPGMLSMANRGPNTNGGQFFITLVPTPWLDGKHTIFGEVVGGMDVVEAIGKVPVSMVGDTKGRPVTPVVIKTVRIERVS